MEKNKKKLIICIVLGVTFLLLLIFSVIFALFNINNKNIMHGVFINGIDVSNLSKNEAKSKIESLVNEKKSKEVLVSYNEYQSSINPTLLELDYDVNSVIEQAYSIGRDSNLIVNNYNILGSLLFKNYININLNLNEEIARNTITDISANLPDAVIQSSYYVDGSNLIITNGTAGNSINEDTLFDEVYNIYSDLLFNDYDIELSVEIKEPDAIDIDKIHEEIYREAKDAYYTDEPFEIYPEVSGVDFDIETAKTLLQENKDEYIIELIITKPTVTINDLGDIAFQDTLSSFTTKYDVSNADRTTNLKLAAKKINGIVLASGEEFSYNKVVGERTIAAGYKEAKVYSNGQVVDGIGGGICQISTTLYNTVVLANLDVTVRRNHQFVTSYVPAGRDATVVYGSQDFKFKNTRKYPVKIVASVANGIVKISLSGIKEDTEYDISFDTNAISTIPFNTTYTEDPNMALGTESVKQKGANGIVTETYKIVKLNGSLVSKTLLSKDTYNAMQKIVVKGTAPASSTPNADTTSPNTDLTPSKPIITDKPNVPSEDQIPNDNDQGSVDNPLSE